MELEKQDQELTLIVMLKAKNGKEKELEKELLSLLEPVRKEPGCILYEFHRSNEDKSLFMFYERYVNQEAHSEHEKKPYVADFLKKAENLLEKPIEITRYTRIVL